MKKNVLLVFCLPVEKNEFMGAIIPPLGLEMLAACTRDVANVRIIDTRFEKSIRKAINEHNPDIIGINVKNTVRCAHAYRMARRCRRLCPDAMLVGGGLHPTVEPEEALKNGFDVVVRGDGEITFRKIVEGKSLRNLKGASYKRNDGFVHNADRVRVLNLDEFPHPARDLRGANYNYSILQGKISADCVETSRGCKSSCTFCAPAAAHHGTWQYHSPEWVVEDLKQIPDSTKFAMICDDSFTADLKRAEAICDGIMAAGLEKTFIVQVRPLRGHTRLKRKMIEAGFMNVTSGAETGVKKNIDKYHKGINPGLMRQINTEWKEAGARLVINSFVFGDPDDSEEDLLGMGDFARESNCDYMDIIWLTPYPGTKIREEYLKKGLLLSNDWRKYSQGYVLVKNPNIPTERLKELRWRTWCRFYSPKRIAYQVMSYIQFFSRKFGLKPLGSLDFLYANRHMVFGNNYAYRSIDYPKREIVTTYIREYLNEFPEDELDMTASFNDFLDIWEVAQYLKPLDGRTIQVSLSDGRENISNMIAEVGDERFESVRFQREETEADIAFEADVETVADMFCLDSESLAMNLLKVQAALSKIALQSVFSGVKRVIRGPA